MNTKIFNLLTKKPKLNEEEKGEGDAGGESLHTEKKAKKKKISGSTHVWAN